MQMTPTIPIYDVYHSFGVTDNSMTQEAVINAAETFQGNVTNTKEVNKPVLTLPQATGLNYKVIGSSNRNSSTTMAFW